MNVGIVGPGRAGTGLGLALARSGTHTVRLHGLRPKRVPAPLTLTTGDGPPPWLGDVDVLVLAVPDDTIRPLAQGLRAGVRTTQTVLHLSGVQGQEALGALVATRAALGSLHPLQTIVDPELAPEHLRGAWAAVEGMPPAVETASRLARDIGMRPFPVAARLKPIYHAGAVFASNYLVVVAAVAQRLVRHAGLSDEEAWEALLPLIDATVDNLRRQGPLRSLTGPVVRGDADTVMRHLAALTVDDARLYQSLAQAALELALKRGLDTARGEKLAEAIATDLPLVLRPEA